MQPSDVCAGGSARTLIAAAIVLSARRPAIAVEQRARIMERKSLIAEARL